MPNRNTKSPFHLMRLGALFAASLAAGACHAEEGDVAPTEARSDDLASMQGTMVEIVPATALDQDELEAIASYLEGKANAARAKVMVRQEASGAQHLEVELWADDALDESIYEQLQADFPILADATITHATVAGPPSDEPGEPGAGMELDKDMSVEEIKAKVEADLRAQGVEGEVHVDVHDQDGERRVEVRVEKTSEGPK